MSEIEPGRQTNSLKRVLLSICLMAGTSANAATVLGELQQNSGDVLPSSIVAVGDDLLQTNLGSVTGEPTTGAVVRDGATGTARDGTGTGTGLWLDNGGSLTTTYNLDVSVNTFGYDIEDIRVFTGWDSNRAQVGYELYYSVVGNAGFTLLGTVGSPADQGAANGTADWMFMTRTYDDGGGSISGLTGVDAIRFEWDFSDNNSDSTTRGAVFREIDVLGAATIPETVAPNPATPNVIMIYYDDMGYSDLGAYGSADPSLTPKLDAFAAEGLMFTAGHSADAVCTPSRYALMTGRYCWRTSRKSGVSGGYSKPLMAEDRFTFAKMFQSLGYKTAMVGKWHIGMQFYSPAGEPVDLYNDSDVLGADLTSTDDDGIDFSKTLTDTPYHRGFDYFFGTSASLDMPPYAWIENDTVLYQGGFVTNGVVDFGQARPATNGDFREGQPLDAVSGVRSGAYDPTFVVSDYLQVQAAKVAELLKYRAADGLPFFIYVPVPAPHKPWAVDADFDGSTPYAYGDYLAQTDHYTGMMLDALADPDGNPLTDDSMVSNTVVFISSDNGPEKAAQQVSLAAGYDGNGPFRGVKRDNWEGGTRVPFMVRWPGVVEPGMTDHACWQGDFFASMAEYLRYDFTPEEAPDAESFLPILLGEDMPAARREGFIQHSHLGQLAIVDQNGEWKLLDGTGSGGYDDTYDSSNTLVADVGGTIFGTPRQLFNLLSDPGEQTNLLTVASPAQESLDKEAELYALLNEIRGDTSYGTDGDSNVPPFDSDEDGIANYYENSYEGLDRDDPSDADDDIEPDGLNNLEEYEIGTSPVEPDTDGDRLGDYEEAVTYGTLPLNQHSDLDSLNDGDEVLIWGTDPLVADSDADGASDGFELSVFTNPNNADSVPGAVGGTELEVVLSPALIQLAGASGTVNDPNVAGDASSGWGEAGDTFVRSRATGGPNQEYKTQLFLLFDLSGISGQVTGARLRIHQDHRLNDANSADLQLARVTESWSTTAGSYPVYDATGVADAFVFGNNGDFGTAVDASGFFSGTVGVAGTDEGFDVFPMVEGWAGGSASNYGFRVAFNEEAHVGSAFSETDDPSTTSQNEALQLILTVRSAAWTDVDSDKDRLLDSYEMEMFGNLDQDGEDDSDHDGFSNFIEQSLGSDPTTNASMPQVELVTTNAAAVELTYHKYNQAGLGVEVLVSEDLTHWSPYTEFYVVADPAPSSELGADYDQVLLEPNSPLPTNLFYKLNVHINTGE